MNNFRTAVNELMNGKIRTDEFNPSEEAVKEPPVYRAPAAPTFEPSPIPVSNAIPQENAISGNLPSIFASDLIIEGTVKSKSDIKLNGYIKGDVSCGGSVYSTGTVDGNIDGINVILEGSTVNGNISVRSSVAVDGSSAVTGDIVGSSLISDGKIKGNIILKDSISLQSNAVLIGNVKAKNIAIEAGSTLMGSIEIKSTPPEPPPAPAPMQSFVPPQPPPSAPQSAPPQMPEFTPASGSVADLLAKKEALKESLAKKESVRGPDTKNKFK
ncbi:MAG: polymer-forming cytoskeletal protein [Clostridiales bacterium]|nr:polymer-forming cytoskeletal protein [Clostridiales bacterium]